MNYSKQKPTAQQNGSVMGGTRYTHPAFGEISVTRSQGSGTELFGSALKHANVLTIRISTAYLDRHLHRDWIHADKQVLSFHMSEAQFHALIASQGGAGVPVTFETRPSDDAPLQICPAIESIETVHETYHRELKESLQAYMEQAKKLTEALEEAVKDGKAGKGKLEELRKMASAISEGMPNTASFIQSKVEETMAKTVAAGQIEIEAFVNDLATRTGIEALRNNPVQLIDHTDNI